MDDGTIVKEIYIHVPPNAVFEFLTNPIKFARWMGPQTKLGTGGSIWHLDVNGHAMVRSKSLKLRRDRKIIFTWGCAKIRQRIAVIDSVVVISLKPQREGTWVQLIQCQLPPRLFKYVKREAGFHFRSRNSGTTKRLSGIAANPTVTRRLPR
jgi:uncharacterized protein YndB with AHSA1/START domain